jgi:transcriptional regulator GlxA family with amidase domain
MKILSLVFPGFTFIDLAGPIQALTMLPEAKSQIVWQKKGVVASDAGVDVHATEDFQSCWRDPDILFVPGNTLGLFNYYRTTAPSTSLPILAVALLGSRVSAAARCCSVQLVCSRVTKPHPTGTRVSSSACLARYPRMQDM